MKPRLLLSNDDGITSPFLPIFSKALSQVADVEIVVPASEQSWIGRAYSRHSELAVKEIDNFGVPCRTVSRNAFGLREHSSCPLVQDASRCRCFRA